MLAGQVAAFFVNGYGGEAIPVDTFNHLIGVHNNFLGTPDQFGLDGGPFETNWNSPDPTIESGNPGNGSMLITSLLSFASGVPVAGLIAGLLAVPSPATDNQFVDALTSKLESDYDDDDIIILIGHSFGADSVLQVAQNLNGIREIDLLATLDRVGTGGFRSPLVGGVTANVKYFYNRWQRNGAFPFDFGSSDSRFAVNDGAIGSDFGITDQKEQSTSRNADGSRRRHGCSALDTAFGDCDVILVTPPLPDLPFLKFSSDNLQHDVFPLDDLIQTELSQIIDGLIPQAPVVSINIQPGTNVDEGTLLTLDGSATVDPNPGDTISYQWSVVSTTGDLSATSTASISNANQRIATISLGDNGTVTFRLTATDNTGRSSSQDIVATGNNVPPTVFPVSNPPIGVRGHHLRAGASFTDPGFLDTHDIAWDFGDGNSLPFRQTNDFAGLNLAPIHEYKSNGTFTILATIRDDDGGIGSNTGSIEIRAVALIPRPNNPGILDLQIGGTTGNDQITIGLGGSGGVDVTINGVFQGNFDPNGDVLIRGQEGNDTITVQGDVGDPVKVFGGEENDKLVLQNDASVEFDGGSQTDTVDLSSLSSQSVVVTGLGTVDGFNQAATNGTFSNTNSIIGSSASPDSLTGLDADASWTVTNNSYVSGGRSLEFSNFEILNGGSATDVFNVRSNSSAKQLNGNGGNDQFNIGNGDLDAISAELTVNGGPGNNDQLSVDDSTNHSGNAFIVTKDQIKRTGAADIIYGTIERATISAGDGGDTFEVLSTLYKTPLFVNGNGAADAFHIAKGDLDEIAGVVTIKARGGSGDRAFLDDSGTVAMVSYVVTPASVTSTRSPEAPVEQPERNFGGVTFDGTLELMRLDGTDAPNTFDVYPSLHTEYYIDGNLPAPGTVCSAAGDFLRLHTEGTTGRRLELTAPGSGNGRWTFTSGHKDVNFESIERFNHVERLAVGTEAGRFSRPTVKVYDAETLEELFEFEAYESTYRGGVRVATGDIDQDGIPDIITAPGRVHEPIIRVFDGLDGTLLQEFTAYEGPFPFGVYVDVGDVTGDLCDDIVTVPGRGVTEVRVFRNDDFGDGFTWIDTFNAFPTSFIGGGTVSIADMNGDGPEDIIIGSGSGMAATVKVFDAATLDGTLVSHVIVREPEHRGGVNVASGNLVAESKEPADKESAPSAVVVTTSNDEPDSAEAENAAAVQSSELAGAAFTNDGSDEAALPDFIVGPGPGPRGASRVDFFASSLPLNTPPLNRSPDVSVTAYADPVYNLRAPVRLVGKDHDQDGEVDDIYAAQGSDGKSARIRAINFLFANFVDSLFEDDDEYHNGFFLG